MAKAKVEKQTSRHWQQLHKNDIKILNATGWKKGFYSWAIEKITLAEFKKRANASVVEIRNPKFLAATKAAETKAAATAPTAEA